MLRTLAGKALGFIVTLLVGGLLGATLARLAPGSDVDERELDARLSEDSLRALRSQNAAGDSIGDSASSASARNKSGSPKRSAYRYRAAVDGAAVSDSGPSPEADMR